MIEIVALACIEVHSIVRNISTNTTISTDVKVELIREVLERSDCEHGDV